MDLEASKSFWNRKAQENALWYVSSYGPYAGRNEEEFWRSGQTIWNDLKQAIGYQPKRKDVVVEIGCGVGRLTRAISPEVGTVFAQDISEEMLEITSRHCLPNVTVVCTGGADLASVTSSCADLVLAYCVFQHLPSLKILKQYLREMQRVAKPGAVVAFTLTPRSWRDSLLPVMRARRRLLEAIAPSGPRELWRREWVGIRPSTAEVLGLGPFTFLSAKDLGNERILFYGRTPEEARGADTLAPETPILAEVSD